MISGFLDMPIPPKPIICICRDTRILEENHRIWKCWSTNLQIIEFGGVGPSHNKTDMLLDPKLIKIIPRSFSINSLNIFPIEMVQQMQKRMPNLYLCSFPFLRNNLGELRDQSKTFFYRILGGHLDLGTIFEHSRYLGTQSCYVSWTWVWKIIRKSSERIKRFACIFWAIFMANLLK